MYDNYFESEAFQVDVIVTFISQNPIAPSSGRRQQQQRRLQISKEGRSISCAVIIQFRSLDRVHDIKSLVTNAFSSVTKRNTYISDMQENNRDFSSINRAKIFIDGNAIKVEEGPGNHTEGDQSLLIGSAFGGTFVVLVGAVLFIFSKHRRKRRAVSEKDRTVVEHSPTTSVMEEMQMSPFIDVQNMDEDVSTLGDPVLGQMRIWQGDGEGTVNGSLMDDYDYTKAYGGAEANPSLASFGLSQHQLHTSGNNNNNNHNHPQQLQKSNLALSGVLVRSDSSGASSRQKSIPLHRRKTSNLSALSATLEERSQIFSDEGSFEEQFCSTEKLITVEAPPGKLGVVIDTPDGSGPTVHAIKETSVLADHILIGDLLISVDDEDTTMMTAVEVSKLIGRKSANPKRTFVFVRSK